MNNTTINTPMDYNATIHIYMVQLRTIGLFTGHVNGISVSPTQIPAKMPECFERIEIKIYKSLDQDDSGIILKSIYDKTLEFFKPENNPHEYYKKQIKSFFHNMLRDVMDSTSIQPSEYSFKVE